MIENRAGDPDDSGHAKFNLMTTMIRQARSSLQAHLGIRTTWRRLQDVLAATKNTMGDFSTGTTESATPTAPSPITAAAWRCGRLGWLAHAKDDAEAVPSLQAGRVEQLRRPRPPQAHHGQACPKKAARDSYMREEEPIRESLDLGPNLTAINALQEHAGLYQKMGDLYARLDDRNRAMEYYEKSHCSLKPRGADTRTIAGLPDGPPRFACDRLQRHRRRLSDPLQGAGQGPRRLQEGPPRLPRSRRQGRRPDDPTLNAATSATPITITPPPASAPAWPTRRPSTSGSASRSCRRSSPRNPRKSEEGLPTST